MYFDLNFLKKKLRYILFHFLIINYNKIVIMKNVKYVNKIYILALNVMKIEYYQTVSALKILKLIH